MLPLHLLIVVAEINSAHGDEPAAASAESVATSTKSISLQPGFRVELLRSAGKDEDSWISMTFDDQGRLVVGLDNTGVARMTLADNPHDIRFEKVESTLSHCRGVLYAYESLYVSATNSKGFYRLRDTNGDDRFDESTLLKEFDYRSRYGHGTNQIVLGPDGFIYLVIGNDVSFPAGTSPDSPYRDPRNDHLLPNPHDAGHDNRVGYILRTDRDGREWEVIAGGLRNQVDLAFNRDGEMFTFDADMEWDVGLPWYRPTRVNHLVSGGEYGWRWGTGKWPDYYEDSLPTNLDVGLSSPTAMVFGTDSAFANRYRDALFMADWQHGRILLVDLIPTGASYAGRFSLFLEGAPLNICDMQFGPDGALYFITGGRASRSGLYRVVEVSGADGNAPPQASDWPTEEQLAEARAARSLRHRLETFHAGGSADRATVLPPQRNDLPTTAEAIDVIWPQLGSEDRWLRFAARKALERQDVSAWRARALQETEPATALTGLVALCRQGQPTDHDAVLAALARIEIGELDDPQLLTLLRTYQLCFIRLGQPTDESAARVGARLSESYPHPSGAANHLLRELLVYLQDPMVVDTTMQMLSGGLAQEEQIRAVRTLILARTGWSTESRRAMIDWLQQASTFRGGHLLPEQVKIARTDFLDSLPADERSLLSDEIAQLDQPAEQVVELTSRPFVQQWKLEDLEQRLDEVAAGRSYHRGRQALLAANCLKCHRVNGAGAQVGPDLTSVGKRFDSRAILQSILTPSQVIDPKYGLTAHVLNDGQVVIGRAIKVGRNTISVETDPLRQTNVVVDRSTIEESFPAKISAMPTGLVDVLTAEEILDLLAILKYGNNPGAPPFGG